MSRFLILSAALCVLASGPSSARADSESQIEVRVIAESEIRITDESGAEVTKRIPATTVVPGDEVIYTISCTNVGSDVAEDVFVTNAIPEHMQFSSAADLAEIDGLAFSIDGGATFAVPAELTVVDAEGNARPAEADDYTHLRWTLPDALAPGTSERLSYRAQLQ